MSPQASSGNWRLRKHATKPSDAFDALDADGGAGATCAEAGFPLPCTTSVWQRKKQPRINDRHRCVNAGGGRRSDGNEIR